jgi:mono/diheme cytochrome c family protein
MKRILLIGILVIFIVAAYGYYQATVGTMGKMMQWLDGNDLTVDLSGHRPPEDTETIAKGQSIYHRHCEYCHGEKGDGTRIRAVNLNIAASDFTGGIYKFRSTPTGSLPTDNDIYTSISRGMRGTGMLPLFDLSNEEKWAVTYYIKTFSERFLEEDIETPVIVPELSDVSTNLVKKGQELYKQAKCGECHGTEGRGDGPKADTLKDDRGEPGRLRSFLSEPFKRGSNIEDIYLSISTGLDGTPMASYGETMPDENRIAIAAYIHSISLSRPRSRGAAMDPLPLTPDEHAGIMISYPILPVGMMRYGIMRLGTIKDH